MRAVRRVVLASLPLEAVALACAWYDAEHPTPQMRREADRVEPPSALSAAGGWGEPPD